MRPIRNIMVCLDLTEMDTQLIRYTAYLCKTLPHKEKIFFVHNVPFDFPEEAEDLIKNLDKPLEQVIAKAIQDRIQKHLIPAAGEVEFEVMVQQSSSTPQTLAQIAADQEIDLTITGKKLTYKGSGMVAERLLRISHFQSHLLLLPETAYHQITNILVPIDFSKASQGALLLGLYLQEQFDTELDCQHVFSIPAHYFPYIPVENTQDTLHKEAQKDWIKFAKDLKGVSPKEVDCEITFNHGKDIAQTIYEYALKKEKDLIVIGSKGKGAVTSFLVGSVAIRLIKYDMHIPVLVRR